MKKTMYFIGSALLCALAWYLFIKPYDYMAVLRVNTFPGAINQSIKAWGKSLDSVKFLGPQDLTHLKQEIQFNDSTYIYTWDITVINDSTSKVKIKVKDRDHSLKTKILIPFKNTDFEKRTKKTILDFYGLLDAHIKSFKVTLVGKASLPATYCAYVSLKGAQANKARGMMQSYPLLSTILVENNVQLNGRPFVEVTHWDMDNDSIVYNFCYPIIRSEKLPVHKNLKYKNFYKKKALKAIYNGNYITSDRAWYALLRYADKMGVKVEKNPIEVFYNNPNMGGNAMEWKAEIYMPIKE